MNKNLSNIFKKILNSRKLKYGSNSVLLIVVVVAIAILLNVVIGIPDLKWDLTANKLFSLDDITKNTLNDLNQDVTIIGLFDDAKVSGSDYDEVTELLTLYQKYPHVKVEYIDPEKNPSILNELDPEGALNLKNEDFIVKSTVNGVEKKKRLEYYDLFQTETDQTTFSEYKVGSNAEQGFTGAIKFVTAEKTPAVYFTSGHSELSVDADYTTIKQYLEKNNYTVNTINLLTAAEIPEDAEIIVVASPKNDLSAKETEMLLEYLKAGGKAVFMFDYMSSGAEFTQLNSMLSEFNVAINNDKVKENDSQRHLPDDQYTMLMDVSSSAIIPEAFNVVLQNSRSISILKNAKNYIETTTLLQTSEQAVGEPVANTGDGDTAGPLDIAVAVDHKGFDAESKILVMGNASFISDSASETYGNYYQYGVVFFLQSLNWMFDQQEELIVPTKNYETNMLDITQLQATVMGIVVTILIPLIILGVGFFVFLRRRHL